MLYIRHELYGNFTGSINAGDINSANDILADEISNILLTKFDTLVDIYSKFNIKANQDSSYGYMLNVILDKSQEYPKILKGVSFLIAENNGVLKKVKHPKSQKEHVDNINKCVSILFELLNKNDIEKKLFKEKVLNNLKLKVAEAPNIKKSVTTNNLKNNRKRFFFFLFLGVGIYLLYRYGDKLFSNSEKSIMEEGGSSGSMPSNSMDATSLGTTDFKAADITTPQFQSPVVSQAQSGSIPIVIQPAPLPQPTPLVQPMVTQTPTAPTGNVYVPKEKFVM